jgi:hypothetical protein
MSSALLFITLFAQSQFPYTFPQQNARTAVVWQQTLNWSQASENESAKKAAECRERRFTTSFNHLKEALNDFAEAYNQGKLDVKKIEEIKKAWRDLENSEVRFRLEKSK